MQDISAILADTAAHGFTFVMSPVSTDHGDTLLGNAPVLVIQDVMKFEASFPGRIGAMLNGSSPRVISQRVTRDLLEKTHIPEGERMKALSPKVLAAILGVRSRTQTVVTVTEKVFELPDGTTTKDIAEFKAAWGIGE